MLQQRPAIGKAGPERARGRSAHLPSSQWGAGGAVEQAVGEERKPSSRDRGGAISPAPTSLG